MTNPICALDEFWKIKDEEGTAKLYQYDKYLQKKSPESILRIIRMGGGPRMGTMIEEYARFLFSGLKKRMRSTKKGVKNTGYDHLIELFQNVLVESKASGYWDKDDFKFQHIEKKHPWHMLLLCGIEYHRIRFWAMNRKTFNELIQSGKITNQGSSDGKSYEGMWFLHSNVKDSLVEIENNDDLLRFAEDALHYDMDGNFTETPVAPAPARTMSTIKVTIAAIKEQLKSLGIKGYSGKNKKALLDMLPEGHSMRPLPAAPAASE